MEKGTWKANKSQSENVRGSLYKAETKSRIRVNWKRKMKSSMECSLAENRTESAAQCSTAQQSKMDSR